MSWLTLRVFLVLSSYSWARTSGQTSCSLPGAQFSLKSVTASGESVNGSVRVAWNTTAPPQCVGSVTVEFRTSSRGPVVATYTTTNISQTEFIQTGLRCGVYYYISVNVTGETSDGQNPTVSSRKVQVYVSGDVPIPVGVGAEATADNTSIRVSWGWQSQNVSICVDRIIVYYSNLQMMHTVGNSTAATSGIVPNLQCDTKYTIWLEAGGGQISKWGQPVIVYLPAKAPPTPTEVTAWFTSTSTVNVTWQWTSSGPAPNCFNTTTVTYHPEGGNESSLQLKDPAATEATLTNFQNNTCYTITVVATAGGHRRESTARKVIFPLQGPQSLSATVLSPTSVHLTWVAPCPTPQYCIYYRGTCGAYINESSLETDRQEHTVGGLQEGINYSFTVNQSGFSGGRVLSTGPVYARTFTAVPSGAPQSLEAMFMQPTKVILRWREVYCFQQNGPITGYVVRYYTTCGPNINMQQNKSEATGTIQIENLTPYTEYAFQVAAVNVNGTGPFTEPITFGGAPQLVRVTAVNSTTVNVSWSEVQCFNGSGAVTHYLVQYQPTCCSGAVQNIKTDGLVQVVSGLTPNAAYTFRVAAVGASKMIGPFSNASLHDEPGSSSVPHSGPTSNSSSQSSTDLVLVVGVAGSMVVLVLVATLGIVVLVIWWRYSVRNKQEGRKDAAVKLADVADTDSVDSKEQQDASVDNTCYMKLSILPPTIVDYQREVQCSEGEQVTLTVKVAGSPTPTVTWLFNGKKVKDNYSTEVGKDGSLTLITVEPKHAGTYTFTVSNNVGSVEGCTKLVVCAEDEERASASRVESNPVTRVKFGEYVSSCHAQNNGGFFLQFQTLPSGEEGHQTTVGKSSEKRLLNRFRNITAYDDHRVVLKSISGGVDCEHDYINAAYIDGYSQGKKYIATQGPLPETVTDFWWMVWQEQIHVVAMVTNTMEGGQKKCEQYWPEQGTQEYGPFKVTLTDQQVFADYTIRRLFVSCDKAGGNQLKVTQFHFTSWPDHGVPEYAGPILNYLRRIKKHSQRPTLVHCSAGVGRTGTLIAIDMALEQAAQENVVDIPAIVTKMRRQRMKMVQNSDQYVFIHDAVLESLTCGDTQIPASGLAGAIEKLKQKDSETGRTGFETQFHVLGLVTPKPTEVIRATASRFPNLNRSMEFLPSDKWRVTLKGETNDYIHASFANGYKQWKGFIITQAPMKSTCRDFWKMVYERECGVIVMLSDLEENGEEVCHQYWPDGSTKGVQKYGEYSVSVLQATEQDGFIERVISITNPKSGEDHKVTQFQLPCWTPEGLCTSPPAIMAVIEHVLVVQRRTGNRPIIVHGSDTVSRCGVFCSFISATECCKTEGIVDVFQVVKALRIQKPGSVLTVEQYRFIFDLMLLFLESFSIYSNFK